VIRLTTDFWVSALLRKVRGENGFAYLARHGAAEAGAIFIKVYNRDGTLTLYGPAPQIFYQNPSSSNERRFITILSGADERHVAEKLEKEAQFDPDIWIVEIENYNDIRKLLILVEEMDKT